MLGNRTARRAAVALTAAGLAAAALAGAAAGQPRLANDCFALGSADGGGFVAVAAADRYRADRGRARATPFYLKPTGLGTYMLYDRRRGLLAVEAGQVRRATDPGPAAEWAIRRSHRAQRLISTAAGRALAARRGELVLASGAGPGQAFRLPPARRCRAFPEARVGAAGPTFSGVRRDGTVAGFADLHLHITADIRAGGRVIHGASFDPFGIPAALGGDERDHGPDGSLDITGNLLRSGTPTGTHDIHGWPTFSGWPVHDTITHQQTYYVWLKRVWKAGLRLVVAQAVEDEPLCNLEPLRSHSCDETETIALEVRRLRALQDYVDAQSGGRGRGWFRLVYGPGQARHVIERGKLAVVIGMETSNPLGCGEVRGEPQCTRAEIDDRIDRIYRLGVRSMFLVHWPDNAFAGAALQPGAKGDFIGLMQLAETGEPFESQPCTTGDEAEGSCNAKGLSALGRYLVRRMIARRMLIEVDHMSQKAREDLLGIAAARRYPLVSSHTGTGGEWTAGQLRRLYSLGGIASATPDAAPDLVAKVLRLRRYRSPRRYFGVALGTDTGGFSELPGPRSGAANPLRYPFRSHDGRVRFARQRSGRRSFDLNRDGVAHYGLFADLVADMGRRRGGPAALRSLFRSAEAYLETWQRALGGRPDR
jgi:microsomal dipeptidase-like Zn-dependent dipeptidase